MGCPVANAASYLVSIGESEMSEVVGYTCHDDEICRIKMRLNDYYVVTAFIQFVGNKAYLVFKKDDQYLYVSSVNHAEKVPIVLKIADSGTTKTNLYLFDTPSTFDDGILRHYALAKILITMTPEKH